MRTVARRARPEVRAHPVHARPDAVRHHRHRHHPGRPETGRRHMVFSPGPVFTNVLLADEINRTPPKTQSALLEAMQEHRVTIQGRTYTLDEPFHVFATQNPIELEGTYPLPEAQLDRFMFHIVIDHPPESEEIEVLRTTTAIQDARVERAVTGAEILAYQQSRAPRAGGRAGDALRAAPGAREPAGIRRGTLDFIEKWVSYGASVRAAQYLILGAKARAVTRGRYHVSLEDVRALAHPVLRHRVLTNFHARVGGRHDRPLIDQVLESCVPVTRLTLTNT
ncbi:MAG: AAA family ATPase [Desulfobacterales bacterium]|nr:AAA family ATPase [Desulfobacterales bacterium]